MTKIKPIKNKRGEVIHPITDVQAVEGLVEELASKQETLVSGENIKKLNGESILGSGEIKITGSGPGSTIVIDGELSLESENPVQNKAITQVLNGKQDELESGVNIKTINGKSIVGEGDLFIQEGDPSAVKFSPQELTESQKEQARRNIDAASLADINDMKFVTAENLPTASADTLGYIFLIGPDNLNLYERYFTQEITDDETTTYEWVSLGSTQIDLSTYATKAEVDQLELKVDGLDEELHAINPHITGRMGIAGTNDNVTVSDLLEYTDQYGIVTLTLSSDGYLWCCLKNDHFRVTSFGVEIPMVYVKEYGDLHCFVSAEKIKAGVLQFVVEGIHPIKADTERVTITARSYTITYGDAIPEFGFIADGVVEGTPSITCEAIQGSDVGEYAIVISRGTVEDDNAIYVNGVLTIAKAELTITADNKQVALGGAMPTFTVQYSGFVLGEDSSVLTTLPTCTTDAVDTDTAGFYTITPSGAVSTNYSFIYVPGELQVGVVSILSFTAQELEDSGSCGGYIVTTSPYEFHKLAMSQGTYGCIIDVRLYRGMRVVFTHVDGHWDTVRFAFLRNSTLTANQVPAFSQVAGFTGLITQAFPDGQTTLEYIIPSDASFMYYFTHSSGYPDRCNNIAIYGTKPNAENKNLTKSLFEAGKGYSIYPTDGTATAVPEADLSDWLETNVYARLGVAKLLVNQFPDGVDTIDCAIGEYDGNKVFIRRDSYSNIPKEVTLAPSCSFIRLVFIQKLNGANVGGSTILFDGNDFQIEGVASS